MNSFHYATILSIILTFVKVIYVKLDQKANAQFTIEITPLQLSRAIITFGNLLFAIEYLQ